MTFASLRFTPFSRAQQYEEGSQGSSRSSQEGDEGNEGQEGISDLLALVNERFRSPGRLYERLRLVYVHAECSDGRD